MTSATTRWWCRRASPITKFSDLASGQRIGVVQGTVEESYVVDILHLQPVKYPGFATLYASLKIAPDRRVGSAGNSGIEHHPTGRSRRSLVANAYSPGNFVAYAVATDNQPLVDALNAGLDAVIADGTWANLYSQWVPRTLPPGWKPGSKAAPDPTPAGLRHDRGEPAPRADGSGRAEVDAGSVTRLVLRLGYVPTSHPHSAHHGSAQHD